MVGVLGMGASLGACVRYFLTNFGKKHFGIHFPFATLFLNVTGALLLGILTGLKLNSAITTVLGTGFLGGYTTFSTFNTELFTLLDDKDYRGARIYFVISYVVGISCAFLGLMIGQKI